MVNVAHMEHCLFYYLWFVVMWSNQSTFSVQNPKQKMLSHYCDQSVWLQARSVWKDYRRHYYYYYYNVDHFSYLSGSLCAFSLCKWIWNFIIIPWLPNDLFWDIFYVLPPGNFLIWFYLLFSFSLAQENWVNILRIGPKKTDP